MPHAFTGDFLTAHYGPKAAIHVDPRVAVCVARYLSAWSWMDALRESMAVRLISAAENEWRSRLAVHEMISAVSSGPARYAAIAAAARATHPGIIDLILWGLDSLKAHDKHRHALAHHVWMVDRAERECLGLIPPREWIAARISGPRYEVRGGRSRRSQLLPENIERLLFWKKAQMWTLSELRQKLTAIYASERHVRDLVDVVAHGDVHDRGTSERALHRLLPRYRDWLRTLRPAQRKGKRPSLR